ncbi:TlpA family protein disulfide reductase [Saccharicrinis sp. GN24d3]|uniref:TlpA family protein disulfide reductase n=1 Tax=Saccharicrinis sp. GN24d3 TaxID=3458416 RepID=UPI004036372B
MNTSFKKLLSFYLPISLLFFACTEKQPANYAIISGTIKSVGDSEVKLSSKFTSISMDTVPSINRSLKINDAGVFVDTVFINGPREFSLGKDRDWVGFLIQPGQHLKITADDDDIKNTSVFSGDGAGVNTYLFKKAKIADRIDNEYRESRGNNEAIFKQKQERYFNEKMDLLNSSEGLPEAFVADQKKDIQYDKLMSYISYAEMYKRNLGNDAPELSSDFLDVLSGVNMQDYSEFQRSITYQFMLRRYYNYQYSKVVDNVWEADPVKQLERIAELVSDKNIKDELFIMYAKFAIPRTPDLQNYYNFFMANVSNKVYQDAVTIQYKDLMATQAGQPSPEFVDYKNIDGSTNSLSDFRGKYVYIDVWATWCGPCKAEIPFLKEVEKKYHDKNIEFISLSVDKVEDTEKWEKFVKEKELGGVQLIADKDWNSEFVQKYQIKGIPQFILIDPDGKIVQPSAPRPSDPKLVELFEKLEI